MEIYLVGGALRNQALGLPVKDRDWLVVGARPERMIELGYQPVGQDFPVFLHPQTKEEYALARTERKSGQGYKGFVFHADESVSLEADLARRDLTINAMAQDSKGRLFDPYGGMKDLQARVLRHVSPAFSEDPLRVLRVARFMAQLAPLGFKLADETFALLVQMSRSGELQTLTPERVFREMRLALESDAPRMFFELLHQVGALAVIFPELDRLFGIPQPEKWHPEIDTGVHSLMVLEQACLLTDSFGTRFASLVHDLGKGLTDPTKWPAHHGHEALGVEPVKQLCNRLKCPKDVTDLALLATEFHGMIHKAAELRPSTQLSLMQRLDPFRRAERFESVLQVCEADSRGRLGFEQEAYPQASYWRGLLERLNALSVKEIVASGVSGAEITYVLTQKRLKIIQEYRDDWTQ
jgi:tRNA nucleotidyltransferase (CCA-adding enzyme)